MLANLRRSRLNIRNLMMSKQLSHKPNWFIYKRYQIFIKMFAVKRKKYDKCYSKTKIFKPYTYIPTYITRCNK